MANPVLQFLTIFGQNEGYGWTERHFFQANSANPRLDIALNNYLLVVCAARQTLLGGDCFIAGARVSYPFAGRVRSNNIRQKLVGDATKASSSPSTSLAIEMQNSTFDQSKIIHLRGFWNDCQAAGSYIGDIVPGWVTNLQGYVNALKTGYGWLSKDPVLSSSGRVLSYTVGTDGLVTFTLDPADGGIKAPLPAFNVVIQFSRFHNSRSPLNGQILCEVVDALTLKTVKPIGVSPTSSTGHYIYRVTGFIPYASSDSISLGERRMGRPLDRYPGRARAKTRY